MSFFDEPPLHDFPDRAIRQLLEHPGNLRDLISDVTPELAAFFDFDRMKAVNSSFLLHDWRRRESDLLFLVPFRDSHMKRAALVCILLEHQSEPDPAMALRVLLYAVLFWEQEWKAWEKEHPRGEPLLLTPVLPIVFHTGSTVWQKNREFADLVGGPEVLKGFAPTWQPLFWNLAERSPRALLDSAREWLNALAVVRAEQENSETFLAVFGETLRRLEELSEKENVRWHDLLWFVLSWGLRRRPQQERDQLIKAAQASQAESSHKKEVEAMSEMVGQTWDQWAKEHYTALGVKEGVKKGVKKGESLGELKARREDLRRLLEKRFGRLPEALAQQIETTEDSERLKACIDQVLDISSLDEFKL